MNVQFGDTAYLGLGLAEIARMVETDADLDLTGVPHELISKLYDAGLWWHHEIRRRPGVVRLVECLRHSNIKPIMSSNEEGLWIEFGNGSLPIIDSTAHDILNSLIYRAKRLGDLSPLSGLPKVLSDAAPLLIADGIRNWSRTVNYCEWGRKNYLFTRSAGGYPLYALTNAPEFVPGADLSEHTSPRGQGVEYDWGILYDYFLNLRYGLVALSCDHYATDVVLTAPRIGVSAGRCVLLTGPPDMVSEVAHRIRSSR